MKRHTLEGFAFLALFAGISTLLFFIFSPFLQILVLAAVFAVVLQKPYESLTRLFRGNRSLAAVSLVGLSLIFCIVPLFFIGVQIFTETQFIYNGTAGGGVHFLQTIQAVVSHAIQKVLPGFVFNIELYVGAALTFISHNLAALVSETVYIVFDTFLMLLAFFFFLRDGHKLIVFLTRVSPFSTEVTQEVISKTHQTVTAVVKGTLLVALIRWVLVGLAFYLFGIPNAILWGSVGGIVGAIPGVGTLLVFVPAIAYLYLQGHMFLVAGLAIFALLVIMLIDNLLTPYFYGKKLAPPLFVLFSILGGIIFFGPTGFIMGPLILSLFLLLLTMYQSIDLL